MNKLTRVYQYVQACGISGGHFEQYGMTLREIAEDAYACADAMLAEREKDNE